MSIWLTTLSKERPFTFLDHAIQCGDSLLGITRLDELDILYKHGRLVPVKLKGIIESARDEPLAAAQLLMEKTVLTVRDAEDKTDMQREILDATEPLLLLGDAVAGSTLASCKGGALDRGELLESISSWISNSFDNSLTEGERAAQRGLLEGESDEWLNTDRLEASMKRRTLHWPLSFPEVFLDPSRTSGFDAIVGNTPFLGGQRITGTLGTAFRQYIVIHIADGRRGSADLVCYFLLRASKIGQNLGFLATNTIAQGSTREVGLDWLLEDGGWTIHHAVKSRAWPGEASLEVSQIWMTRRPWEGKHTLIGMEVIRIDSQLEVGSRVRGLPEVLESNKG